MKDEIDELAAIRPDFVAREEPPPLDWTRIEDVGHVPALASVRNGRHRRRFAWIAVAATATLAISTALLFRPDGPPAFNPAPTTSAGPPTTSAPQTLIPRLAELADLAQTQPVTGTGPIRYSRSHVWLPSSPSAALRDGYVEDVWIDPSGTGLVERTPNVQQSPPVGPFSWGDNHEYPGSQEVHPECWSNTAGEVRSAMNARPDASLGAASLMWWMQFCALDGGTSPTAQATILREFSTMPGIETIGSVSDRLGRSGEGFLAVITPPGTETPTSTLIILDPATGELLAFERATVDAATGPYSPEHITVHEAFAEKALVKEVGLKP